MSRPKKGIDSLIDRLRENRMHFRTEFIQHLLETDETKDNIKKLVDLFDRETDKLIREANDRRNPKTGPASETPKDDNLI